MRSLIILFGALFLFAGCAAYKPLTLEEAAKYKTVSNLIKARYGGMTLRYFTETVLEDRYLLSYKVLTTEEGLLLEKRKIVADLLVYCENRGGNLKDFKEDNELRLNELKKKFTYEEELRTVFECGPKGKGRKLTDWSKFNPAKCRTLKEKRTDMDRVNAEYGSPAGFGCVKEKANALLFMGSIDESRLQDGYYIEMKLNEARKEPLPLSEAKNLK